MADNKPPQRDRKPSYISPLIIAVIVAAIGAITFLRLPSSQKLPPPAKTEVAAPAVTAPPASIVPQILTREDLIREAALAASEFAASGKLAGGTASLVGKRFAVSIPFGCGGFQNSLSNPQLAMSYDAEQQSIVLTARPGAWTTLPLIQGLASGEIDAVEGFWIPRPWTSAQSCPPQMDYPAPVTPTPPTAQTIGLAQIFPTGGSRLSRHAERPYIFTRKIAAGDNAALSSTYRLVLEGRITGFTKDSALRCWMEAPDHQPLCLFAVTFERVAFADGETGKQIATWTN